jgi:hypothetical protein
MYPNLNQMPDWEPRPHQQQQQDPAPPPDLLAYLLSLLQPAAAPQPSAPPPDQAQAAPAPTSSAHASYGSPPPPPPPPQSAYAPPPPSQTAYGPPPPPPFAGWSFAYTANPPFEWNFTDGGRPAFHRLRQLIANSCRLTGWTTLVLVLLLLVGPGFLFRMVAYFTLAAGLGLHLPTLVAGHLLYLVVGGLACAEPLLVAGVLLWAAHKLLVRRQPLIDRNYWRCHLQRNC